MFSLLLNRKKLLTLKNEILGDTTSGEIPLKYMKRIRAIIVAYFVYFYLTIALMLAYPLVSSDEFAMSIYIQLPFTE